MKTARAYMTFGKYKGKRLYNIPTHYMMWFVNNVTNTDKTEAYKLAFKKIIERRTSKKTKKTKRTYFGNSPGERIYYPYGQISRKNPEPKASCKPTKPKVILRKKSIPGGASGKESQQRSRV